VLIVRQRGAFAGGADRANAIGFRLDLKIDKPAEGGLVDFPIPKGGD